MIKNIFETKTDLNVPFSSIVQGNNYRFTVLTNQLIRMEYNKLGVFENSATQIVINRNFPEVSYKLVDEKDNLEIITKNLHLVYDKDDFSSKGLSIQVNGNVTAFSSKWFFGIKPQTLKGTTKTLDNIDGYCDLEEGLISKSGFAILDDSKSMLLCEDGYFIPRSDDSIDMYFFGYGHDYLDCLKDFFKLSGNTPLIPRNVLGNWWSRFHRYSEDEYKDLICRFERENIPFSVAVIDMDWHITQIDQKFGSGWTGYTWNLDLFKNPKDFIAWLHAKNMYVTLNVHPADGIRPHEQSYIDIAKALEVKYQDEIPVSFDISDKKFVDAYFKYLHNPNEDIGVDFWWIDWQQDGGTRKSGYDTLFLLNHYHYLNIRRTGKLPIILSRFAGPGSHRYPLGFSGDAYITWESLDFQPYFTSTSSNIGYGWWSHDIGGHMCGIRNEELATRWIQLGVFSPIMRLHGCDNPFIRKEPWFFSDFSAQIMKKFLILRHQLVPYIYTMNYIFHTKSLPLIQPMYYRFPELEAAYSVKNQYYFGCDLIVCPITKKMDENLLLGYFDVWLPDGMYFDFFNGRIYKGSRRFRAFRGLDSLPVFSKFGSIIPMQQQNYVSNCVDNPKYIEFKIFAGDDGNFELYEDKGQLTKDSHLITTLNFKWAHESILTISSSGDFSIVGDVRNYKFSFVGFMDGDSISVDSDNISFDFSKSYDLATNCLIIEVFDAKVSKDLVIKIKNNKKLAQKNIQSEIFDILNMSQIDFELKKLIYKIFNSHTNKCMLITDLQATNMHPNLLLALSEIIFADDNVNI